MVRKAKVTIAKAKVTIANLDPEREAHSGWLVVNCDNGREQYWRTKELAISVARDYKNGYGGKWVVKPTYDPGPYIKPGEEKELVG